MGNDFQLVARVNTHLVGICGSGPPYGRSGLGSRPAWWGAPHLSPNDPEGAFVMARFAKAWTALSGLVLLIVGTELGADSKWYKYAVAALTVIAVYVVPNKTTDA